MGGNKRYKLRILAEASTEILDLFSFFEEQKEGFGDLFLDKIGDFFLKIETNPEIWQFVDTKKEKIRRGFLKIPQAVVLYKIEGLEVIILSVKHIRSNWQKS